MKTAIRVTSVKSDYGTLTIDPVTGRYSFTVDNDSSVVQALDRGVTKGPALHGESHG